MPPPNHIREDSEVGVDQEQVLLSKELRRPIF